MTTQTRAQPKILVGATGSVASIKVPELIDLLVRAMPEARIKIIATEKALVFFKPRDIAPGPDLYVPDVFTDVNDWSSWKSRGDPVLHIQLRDWADLLVVAPLDANTLAKVANGLADNLLTCIIRAWHVRQADRAAKPVLLAPAMNTGMWDHPLTKAHLETLTGLLGFQVIQPISKVLMCGEHGMGAMAEPQVVVDQVVKALNTLPK